MKHFKEIKITLLGKIYSQNILWVFKLRRCIYSKVCGSQYFMLDQMNSRCDRATLILHRIQIWLQNSKTTLFFFKFQSVKKISYDNLKNDLVSISSSSKMFKNKPLVKLIQIQRLTKDMNKTRGQTFTL